MSKKSKTEIHGTRCPSIDKLSEFTTGGLCDSDFDWVSDHLDECAECQKALHKLDPSQHQVELWLQQSRCQDPFDDELMQRQQVLAQKSTFPGTMSTMQIGLGPSPKKQLSSEPEVQPLTSDDLGDRYETFELLGVGGIGAVTRARDLKMGREVAIKVLHHRYLDHPEIVQRFTEESQIACQLQHPGILPIYEVGRCTDGRPYFTMKRVVGDTLREFLDRPQDRQSIQQNLQIFLRICQAVSLAHERGVVHRDLKPVNIMVGQFGEVQVMDWGLAKVLSMPDHADESSSPIHRVIEDPDVSQTGSVFGTLSYMSPEQAKGEVESIDPRSDVFALGAILFETLVGHQVYQGDRASIHQQAIECQTETALAKLETASTEKPLIDLVRHCLAADSTKRPQNASIVATAIEDYLQSMEERVRTAEIKTEVAKSKAVQERRTRRLTHALVAVVFSVSAIVAIWWFTTYQTNQRQAERLRIELLEQISDARGSYNKAFFDAQDTDSMVQGIAAIRQAAVKADQPLAPRSLKREVQLLQEKFNRLKDDRRAYFELERALIWPSAIDTKHGHFDRFEMSEQIRQIIEAQGFQVYVSPVEQVALAVRNKPPYLRDELLVALHWWAVSQKAEQTGDQKQWITDIANLADMNETRSKIRELGARQDIKSLVDLAKTINVTDHAPETINTLAAYIQTARPALAIQLLKKAQRLYPDDFWINSRLGSLFLTAWPVDYSEAIRFYSTADALRPNNPGAMLNLAESFRKSGRLLEAKNTHQRVIELAPNYTDAYRGLAWAHVEMGQVNDALRIIAEAVDVDPQRGILHSDWATFLKLQNKKTEAFRHSELAVQLSPNSGRCQADYAGTLITLGQYDRAWKASEKAIQLNPLSPLGYHFRGRIRTTWATKEKNQEAKSKLLMLALADQKKALQLRPDLDIASVAMANVYAHLGDYDKALPLLDQIVAQNKNNWGVLEFVAFSYRQMGKLPQARKLLIHIENLERNNLPVLKRISSVLTRFGFHRDGLRICQRIEKQYPNDTVNLFNMAVALARGNDLSPARAAYERLLKLDPRNWQARKNLGNVLSRLGLYKESAVEFSKSVEGRPTDYQIQFNLGNQRLWLRQFDQAIQAYRQANKLNPDHALTLFRLAQAEKSVGNFKEAYRLIQKAHRIGQKQDGWNQTSESFVASFQRLIQISHEITELKEGRKEIDNAEQRLEFACVAQMQQVHGLAFELFQQALKENPEFTKRPNPAVLYLAACSAINAASAKGVSDQDAEVARNRAYQWLKSDFDRKKSILLNKPNAGQQKQTLLFFRMLQSDPCWAEVRLDALQKHQRETQNQWANFWGQVDAEIKRIQSQLDEKNNRPKRKNFDRPSHLLISNTRLEITNRSSNIAMASQRAPARARRAARRLVGSLQPQAFELPHFFGRDHSERRNPILIATFDC